MNRSRLTHKLVEKGPMIRKSPDVLVTDFGMGKHGGPKIKNGDVLVFAEECWEVWRPRRWLARG